MGSKSHPSKAYLLSLEKTHCLPSLNPLSHLRALVQLDAHTRVQGRHHDDGNQVDEDENSHVVPIVGVKAKVVFSKRIQKMTVAAALFHY